MAIKTTTTDYNKKTFSGVCNAATAIFRSDIIAPAAPQYVWSVSGEGFVDILWDKPADSDVTAYNVYRRTKTSGLTRVGANVALMSYRDTTVQNGQTYYYAVTALDASGNESGYSVETAETYFALTIKSYATSLSAAVAAVGDVNGDGLPDLIVGYPAYSTGKKNNIGKVDVYYGGNTTGSPDATLTGEYSGDQFGNAIAVVDLNNDGYAEIIVGAPFFDPYLTSPIIGTAYEAGKIYVYAGGPQFSATPAFMMNGKWGLGSDGTYYMIYAENLGFSAAAAGDINNDGYQDVVFGAPYGGTDRSGRIVTIYGGPDLTALGTSEFRNSTHWQLMGYSVSSGGDVNNDGYSDIVAGGPGDNYHNYNGSAHLLLGGAFERRVFVYTTGIGGDWLGTVVAAAGDMNGDGYADIAVGARTGGMTRVYFGGPTYSNEPGIVLYQETGPPFLAPLGDINYDGFGDLLSNGPTVHFGNAAGDNVPDIVRTGGTVLGAADMNNDGVKEIIVQDAAGIHALSLAPYLALPEIGLLTPQDRVFTMNPTLSVQGAVKGDVVKVSVRGQVAALQPDGSFTAAVDLKVGDNIIEILAETPDGKISKRKVTVTHALPPPLTVSILTPSDNAVVNNTPVTVSGSVSDFYATVLVNGIHSSVTGTSFTASGVNLAEGANAVTASANDNYGQTASQSVTITLLTKGTIAGVVTHSSSGTPLAGVTVSVTDPRGTHTGATAANGTYTISGVTQGNFTATFTKSGYLVRTENGALAAGQTLTLDISLSATPPLSLVITSPADGAMLGSSSLQVSGNVTNSASVTVNGIAASVTGGAFSATVPLREGPNTVTATAADQYNQTASRSITVTLAGLIDQQEIFATPLVLSFPAIWEGTSWSLDLTVTNIGAGNLVIDAMNQQPQPFWIAANGCSGTTLPPSASCTITVRFAPPVEGSFTRTLLIPSNDADHPNFAVTLNGTATAYAGYVLPDTGQQTCSGIYQRNPLSYATQGDGTIIDNNTGLQWQQEDDNHTRTWADAGAYCGSLSLGNRSGWRLPTRNELLSIVDYGKQQPAVDSAMFPATDPASYWSATENINDAWIVDFASGSATHIGKTTHAAVRCVAGTQLPDGPLWSNGDFTETDLVTGLMWAQGITDRVDWQTVLYYSDNVIFAGYSDWRMPTIKELVSRYFISNNECSMADCSHWSSTTLSNSECNQAFAYDGSAVLPELKTNRHLYRFVRGGRVKTASVVPTISSVNVTAVTLDSATVTWTTDQPADSLVEYGTTASYSSSALDQTPTTSHSITLTGLTQATTYHFRVSSSNSAGLSTSSGDSTFTTASPPIISAVATSNITSDSVTVTWTTDQPADSLVEYGGTTAYGSAKSDTTMTTSHSVTLTGLSPSTTYHYRVTSKNPYNLSASSQDSIVTTGSPITVTITSPASGATITRPDVTVQGTISNTAGNETGVTVNGVAATVTGSGFTANHMPLSEGTNIITVTATDTAGNTASSSVTVNAASGRYITLTPNIGSGISPLEVTLRIDGSFTIMNSDVSYTGPGTVEFLSGGTVDNYPVRMTTEGTYYFTAEVTDDQNTVYTDTIEVVVQNKAVLDALLKAKWEGMKSKLANQDVANAVSYFNSASQQLYSDLFTALNAQLQQLVQEMQDIQLIYVRDGTAKYRIIKNEIYDGQMLSVVYYIYFALDENGIWKIAKF